VPVPGDDLHVADQLIRWTVKGELDQQPAVADPSPVEGL
jgi:hypothetical protein